MKSYYEKLMEYVTNPIIYFRDYLNLTDDQKKSSLPEMYPYLFKRFFNTDTSFQLTPDDAIQYNKFLDGEIENYELIELLSDQTITKFSDWLFNLVKMDGRGIISSEQLPAWTFFGNKPQLVKNQWLIHFTDNADDIVKEGFRYGVNDYTKLGLTTYLGKFEKQYGGYNFAYLLSDFDRYGIASRNSRNEYKYGEDAVIFRASGIRTDHNGDEEPQVIFYGNTATNINKIYKSKGIGEYSEDYYWTIDSKDGKHLYYNEELPPVVDWFVKNYDQYRKQLN